MGEYLGTGSTGEKIGDKYRITKQRVHQIIKGLIDQSHNLAPASLREEFPRDGLATRKPLTLGTLERRSQAYRKSKMDEVVAAIDQGKSFKKIKEKTGVSTQELVGYRRAGLEVPFSKEALSRRYQKNLEHLACGELNDRQIKELFEDMEKNNRVWVCEGLKKLGVLVPLTEAARDQELYVHTKCFASYKILKKLAIPAVRVERKFMDKDGKRKERVYFYVLGNHKRTQSAFSDPLFDPFRKNPVQVLGKVTGKIPTTHILKNPSYLSVGSMLRKRGILISQRQVRKYVGPDCPVSVFSPRGSLIIACQDTDKFISYLLAKK